MRKRLVLGLVVTLFLLGFAVRPAQATPLVQLGFLVDSSASIGPANFDIIRSGMAEAFANVLPTDGSVEVTVIRFGTVAQVIVAPTVVDSALVLDAVVSQITTIPYTAGSTNMPAAIDLLTSQVQTSSAFGSIPLVYNMMTDGLPSLFTVPLNAETIASRNAAIALGLDEFDAEFIVQTSESGAGYEFLLNDIVYPEPGHAAPPYSPGFVVPVTFENFEGAFEAKLEALVSRPPRDLIPEPASLVLLGTGLVVLARFRRRRSG